MPQDILFPRDRSIDKDSPMSSPSPTCSKSYTVNLRMPRTKMISATPSPAKGLGHHHNRDLALQKYLLLQEQHESLQQHLGELRPLMSSMPAVSSTTPTSPATSPPLSPFTPFPTGQTSPFHTRRSSLSQDPHRRPSLRGQGQAECGLLALGLEADLDVSTATGLAAEEAKLFDINEGIKRTLTELLNCDAVRSDRSFRSWVQRRLMDAEKELRSGRRRRGPRSREGSGQWCPGRSLLDCSEV